LTTLRALVIGIVVGGRPAAAGPAAFAVPDLVGRLGNHGFDLAAAQVLAYRAFAIRLVAAQRAGSGTRSARQRPHPQLVQQKQPYRAVAAVPGRADSHQRQTSS